MSFKNIKVSTKLGLFLAVLAGLLVANFCSIIYFMSVRNDMAPGIELTGYNRMLTQRIAYLCERTIRGQDVKKELGNTVTLLDGAFEKLCTGGIFSAATGARPIVIPRPSAAEREVATRAEAAWAPLKEAAVAILTQPLFKDSISYRVSADSSAFMRSSFATKVNPDIRRALVRLEQNADPVFKSLDKLMQFYVEQGAAKRASARTLLLAITAISLILLGWGLYIIRRFVITPVNELNDIATNLEAGDLNIETRYNAGDEIGAVIRNLKKATLHLGQAVEFAGQIGTGSFDSSYAPSGEKDALGHSLLNMRNKLQHVNREDKKRNWTTEGLAKFAEIVRSNQNDVEKLGDTILTNLVDYIEANQAALFLVNDEDIEDIHLQLIAVYAWERKKFGEKRIARGEGLLGQVWLEKEFLYLREIPADFVEITSGLGKATPRTLMVVPLKVNDNVFGLLEIASFRDYELYEREFILKLSELIGVTLSSAKINARTAQLLEQSQTHTHVMREQEEIMRQTMEEMQATQEEVSRKEKEYVMLIEQLQQTIASQERRIRELHEEERMDEIRKEMEKALVRGSQRVPNEI